MAKSKAQIPGVDLRPLSRQFQSMNFLAKGNIGGLSRVIFELQQEVRKSYSICHCKTLRMHYKQTHSDLTTAATLLLKIDKLLKEEIPNQYELRKQLIKKQVEEK